MDTIGGDEGDGDVSDVDEELDAFDGFAYDAGELAHEVLHRWHTSGRALQRLWMSPLKSHRAQRLDVWWPIEYMALAFGVVVRWLRHARVLRKQRAYDRTAYYRFGSTRKCAGLCGGGGEADSDSVVEQGRRRRLAEVEAHHLVPVRNWGMPHVMLLIIVVISMLTINETVYTVRNSPEEGVQRASVSFYLLIICYLLYPAIGLPIMYIGLTRLFTHPHLPHLFGAAYSGGVQQSARRSRTFMRFFLITLLIGVPVVCATGLYVGLAAENPDTNRPMFIASFYLTQYLACISQVFGLCLLWLTCVSAGQLARRLARIVRAGSFRCAEDIMACHFHLSRLTYNLSRLLRVPLAFNFVSSNVLSVVLLIYLYSSQDPQTRRTLAFASFVSVILVTAIINFVVLWSLTRVNDRHHELRVAVLGLPTSKLSFASKKYVLSEMERRPVYITIWGIVINSRRYRRILASACVAALPVLTRAIFRA